MAYSDDRQILVHPDLGDTPNQIGALVQKLTDEMDELKSYTDRMPELWGGGASADYQLVQQDWHRAWRELAGPDGVLHTIGLAVGVSYGNYCDGEAANRRMWQRR